MTDLRCLPTDKLARNLVVVLLLAFLGVAAQVTECYYLWAHGGESDAACEVLKLTSSFLTLWLVAFLFMYYRRQYEFLSGWLSPNDCKHEFGYTRTESLHARGAEYTRRTVAAI